MKAVKSELLSNMNELFLTFFYCGKAKKAPGTVGSFASVILWFLVTKFCLQENSIAEQNIFWGIFLIICTIYGALAIPFYAKKTGEIDHGSIVLDEVVGQILALQLTFFFCREGYFAQENIITIHLVLCFVLFRFFDIKKPSIIGWVDKNLKNGFGVMLDDVLSGLAASLVAMIIIFVHQGIIATIG